MENLTVLGTSHIAKESVEQIREFIDKEKPDIIAIELDRKRLPALFAKKKQSFSIYNILRVGLTGFLFGVIGSWASKKLGGIVGMDPGSDMKTAVKLARKNNIQLALIDQDIEITLRRFSEAFTWREKLQIIKDIFEGLFNKEKVLAKYHHLDLTRVPKDDLLKMLLDEVKLKYPSLYNVLITERNKVMVKNLRSLQENNPNRKILVVVGAGHKEGIESLLNKQSKQDKHIAQDKKNMNMQNKRVSGKRMNKDTKISYSFSVG